MEEVGRRWAWLVEVGYRRAWWGPLVGGCRTAGSVAVGGACRPASPPGRSAWGEGCKRAYGQGAGCAPREWAGHCRIGRSRRAARGGAGERI